MKQITSLTDKKISINDKRYILALLIGLFLFSACDQQEDKKVDKTSTEQPQDSVPAPQITEEIKEGYLKLLLPCKWRLSKEVTPSLTKLSSIQVMDENGLKKIWVALFFQATKKPRTSKKQFNQNIQMLLYKH